MKNPDLRRLYLVYTPTKCHLFSGTERAEALAQMDLGHMVLEYGFVDQIKRSATDVPPAPKPL